MGGNGRLEEEDVFVPPKRAHDSDVTDEISEPAGLAETPFQRSATAWAARHGGERQPVTLAFLIVTLEFGPKYACTCLLLETEL